MLVRSAMSCFNFSPAGQCTTKGCSRGSARNSPQCGWLLGQGPGGLSVIVEAGAGCLVAVAAEHVQQQMMGKQTAKLPQGCVHCLQYGGRRSSTPAQSEHQLSTADTLLPTSKLHQGCIHRLQHGRRQVGADVAHRLWSGCRQQLSPAAAQLPAALQMGRMGQAQRWTALLGRVCTSTGLPKHHMTARITNAEGRHAARAGHQPCLQQHLSPTCAPNQTQPQHTHRATGSPA